MGSEAEYEKSLNEDSIKPRAEYDKSLNEDSIKLRAEYDEKSPTDYAIKTAELNLQTKKQEQDYELQLKKKGYNKSLNEDSIKPRAEYEQKSPIDDTIKKAELDFLKKKQEQDHKLELKKKELGFLGRFFGGGLYASKNITALICTILLLVAVIFSFAVYYGDCNKDKLIEYFWDSITPIITLSLGYLFGRK